MPLKSAPLQHPVPDTLLKAIGDMTVSFAMLESTMQSLLGSLILEHQRIGQIVSAFLSFGDLRAALVSLYVERHGQDDDFDTLRAMLTRAGTIEQERNRITHSVWGAGDSSASISRLKVSCREKDGYQFKSEQYNEGRLCDFANSIKALAGEFHALQVHLLGQGKVINSPGAKFW